MFTSSFPENTYKTVIESYIELYYNYGMLGDMLRKEIRNTGNSCKILLGIAAPFLHYDPLGRKTPYDMTD